MKSSFVKSEFPSTSFFRGLLLTSTFFFSHDRPQHAQQHAQQTKQQRQRSLSLRLSLSSSSHSFQATKVSSFSSKEQHFRGSHLCFSLCNGQNKPGVVRQGQDKPGTAREGQGNKPCNWMENAAHNRLYNGIDQAVQGKDGDRAAVRVAKAEKGSKLSRSSSSSRRQAGTKKHSL